MAIENTYLLGKNITLGCGFDLQAKAPLDSRQTVPAYASLQALINGDAAYEGMIVYDEETKKTYQAQKCDAYTVEVDGKTKTYDITFREFGINEAELKDLIASETTAAMEFKGAAAALPENPSKGDFYKVTAEFAVGEETAKVGDSIVYDGSAWCIIPSGDDIEDTWRTITGVNNDATLTFAAGDKLAVAVASTGEIKYSHEAIDAPELLAENEQTRTYITEVETDGFGHITGYKTATENVVDTNTTYEFEGQAEESSVYFTAQASDENADPITVYLDAYSKNEVDELIESGNFKTKQTEYSAEGSNKKTITSVAQNANGEVEVVYEDIDFSHNHDEQYKKLQDAVAAVATDANTFVDTIAQDENGEITITTKAVDFSGVETELGKKIESIEISTGDAAGQIKYSVDGAEAINVDVNGFATVATTADKSWNAIKALFGNDVEDNIDQGAEIYDYIAGEIEDFKTETVDPLAERVKAIEDAPYTTKKYVDDQDADILAQAKAYADGKEHKNTTYSIEATENALEFTVTPSEGEAQTVTLVAPEVNVGITSVTAGNADIEVSTADGVATVSHKTYQTGTVKDAAHDSDTDPSFITGISIENGHVTGATVRNLAEVLEAMEFIFDGGSAN